MLGKRLLSSIIWTLFLWLAVFIFPDWFFAAVTTAIVGVGLYEFFNMVAAKRIMVYKYFGIITGCLIPITTYFQYQPSEEIEFILIAAACLAVFLLQFRRRETENALTGIAVTIFGIFYIGWFFSFMIKLKIAPPRGLDGSLLVVYLLLVTKAGDIAAYFVGTAFGKHYLIPRISPKKSVEGTAAGMITSFIVAVSLKGLLPQVDILHIVIIGTILSCISQIGDLSESLIKRDCKVKDSSSLFPGLGGMLDLVDSLLFTTPIFYFYLKLIP